MVTAIMLCALMLGAHLAFADGVGWRMDGTGKYPDATPVTEFSTDTNVVWARPMENWSNANPVIVGEKLFICVEPNTLMCLNLNDGTILWQAPHDYTDVAEADALADMEQKQAEYNDLRGQIGQVGKQMRQLRKQRQDDPDNAELKTKAEQLKQQMTDLQTQMKPYMTTWYVLPPAHAVNGYTSATPVSDGEHVWTLFGNGIAACYDLDGNRVWARPLDKPLNAWGHSASPILADGKVIVHVLGMKALDALTGDLVWEAAVPNYWGTSAVVEIEDTPIIITPKGNAVNATDGTVLAEKMGNCTYAAPVVADGIVYFADDNQPWRAVKLPETLEPFAFEELWQARPLKARYYGSPIVHEGIVYGVTNTQTFSALDAATGELLYEQALGMGKGECYPSVTLAGEYLFVGCDNGEMVVVAPGNTYVEVARNSLEPFRASPVFAGGLMYLRGYDNMYCIGAQ